MLVLFYEATQLGAREGIQDERETREALVGLDCSEAVGREKRGQLGSLTSCVAHSALRLCGIWEWERESMRTV